MPATESVPDGVPRQGWTRRTKSTNRVRGVVDGRQSGTTCSSGSHPDPPVASVRGTESHTMTSGPTPSPGTNPRRIVPHKGPGRSKRRTDSGTKSLAPALEDGDSRAGGGSASPAVVHQSNRQTAEVEKSCPPSRQPKSSSRRWWRSRPGSKKRSRLPPPPVCAAHPPSPPEDWEKDIQQVELVDWEKRSFGSQPYGPEDLISFSLRDVSLYSGATPTLPIAAIFSPARGHPGPVSWTCPRVPPEEGQFTDPED